MPAQVRSPACWSSPSATQEEVTSGPIKNTASDVTHRIVVCNTNFTWFGWEGTLRSSTRARSTSIAMMRTTNEVRPAAPDVSMVERTPKSSICFW
eukprot:3634288-Rhodomonas_salina.1